MRRLIYWQVVLLITLAFFHDSLQAKKQRAKSYVVTDIDAKAFRKLLRTKINVLVLFVNDMKGAQPALDTFDATADLMKGQATLVSIDCSNSEEKKICKKMKINPDLPYMIKHFKDGDFHKDYDRSITITSMSNFLRDPNGDLPWEEDPAATDVYHLANEDALNKFLKRSAAAYKKSMVMFYAPWCGYCKILKPEYVKAAADLKQEALLAAIDLSKPSNSKIRQSYNITGFPTLYYYEKGQLKYTYQGDNKRDAIVKFIRDPTSVAKDRKEETNVQEYPADSAVKHLSDGNFDVLSNVEHALVAFHAPWCAHCKELMPEFEKAAIRIKDENINGILAAVDVTKEARLAERFAINRYPTIKYFNKGEFKFDAGHTRHENQIVDFIKNPQEAPGPAKEQPWADDATAVRNLDAHSFRAALRKVKHALVIFYAPWCSHCRNAKPEFISAAKEFEDELMVTFGAVDCTTQQELCANYNIPGYPTFKYFSYYDKLILDYDGGRKAADFVNFIHSQMHEPTYAAAKTAQEAGFGVNVQIATDADFLTIINRDKPTLVMFYAAFCSHCVTAKPAFSRLATTYKEGGGKVQVISLDAADNPKTADYAKIEILPTFKMYVSGKEVAVYDGDRSYDHLLAFCKSFEVKDEL